MTNVSMELMYAVLKSIQARQAQMGKLDELKYQMQASRVSLSAVHQEITGVQHEIASVHATLIRHEHRLDRIERRLELGDTPTLS